LKSASELLTQYAAYHRDRRNIATHFVGVPLIVFSIVLALGEVEVVVNGFAITMAAVFSIASCIYYFKLDLALGVALAGVLFGMCAGASEIVARVTTGMGLGLALAIFTVGWALQFLGHKYEGMKPAFFDDVRQLLIGPLFVCAEAFFLVGAKADLRRYIEDRVGPTVPRRTGVPEDAATR
jgi:uncharacterized membrane protein YGL010W